MYTHLFSCDKIILSVNSFLLVNEKVMIQINYDRDMVKLCMYVRNVNLPTPSY